MTNTDRHNDIRDDIIMSKAFEDSCLVCSLVLLFLAKSMQIDFLYVFRLPGRFLLLDFTHLENIVLCSASDKDRRPKGSLPDDLHTLVAFHIQQEDAQGS